MLVIKRHTPTVTAVRSLPCGANPLIDPPMRRERDLLHLGVRPQVCVVAPRGTLAEDTRPIPMTGALVRGTSLHLRATSRERVPGAARCSRTRLEWWARSARACASRELRKHAIAEAIAVPARTPPFVRCEHVIGAAVGSLLAQAKQAPGVRADGETSRGRHLFVSDDERVAALKA